MGKNQGLIRLSKGSTRKLTKSELKRGYIFITMDKAAKDKLGNVFNVMIFDNKLTNKRIDSSGRISVGVKNLRKAKDGKVFVSFSKKGIFIG